MRLDKYVTLALFVSRKDAKRLIISKKIQVFKDNYLINAGIDYDVTAEDVYYNDERIYASEYIYIMMNKPSGYISSTEEKRQKCVLDLIGAYKTRKLGIVGRLDIDTEGLLIITDDGVLIHKLTSPKIGHEKKYYVKTDKRFNEDDIESFRSGVYILVNGEKYLTKPAKLEIIDGNAAYLTITEGKFHQIKLMVEAVGKHVTYLKRVEINGLKLDSALKLGEYRLLSSEEIETLKK